VIATVHPSAILRMPDRGLAEKEYRVFVKDLRVAGESAGILPLRKSR
jgi:hypothetical protein